MVKMSLNDLPEELSPEELAELKAASEKPLLFDEESPEMTALMLKQFKHVRRAENNKQTVSLRLSPATLKKARTYGKGYTAFLSRLLDEAINDDAIVRRCL